jgi:hypothetical protein
VTSWRRSTAALLAAALVFLAGIALASCGGDGSDDTTTTTQTTTETTTDTTTDATTTSETTTTTVPEVEEPTVVRIVVVNGQPRGGIVRASVDQGDRVVLVVRSDVADHVHLHGYDLMRNVAPGMPARLPFRATIAGRFEVELEDRGTQIAELSVEP